MTKIIRSLTDWRQIRKSLNTPQQTIGFVPTMGNLHIGHESLLSSAKQENSISVLSIFVNSTQFNSKKDYENYPQTIEHDINIAKHHKTDYILMPSHKDLYLDNYNYKITEHNLSQLLEGEHRPGHFCGVLTIVLKLLLLVKPNSAYFGEKDYQQLLLIQGLADAFFLDVDIKSCPTIRNKAGLAYSSRNNRLSSQGIKQAELLPQLLRSSLSCQQIHDTLTKNGFRVDYIQDYDNRRFAAAWLEDVRLIDNVPIKTSVASHGE